MSASEYFSEIKEVDIDKDQLALAKELIRRNTAKFDPSKFVDDYELALRELIEAKVEHQPVPREEKTPKRAKVINLMDALRKSVNRDADSGHASAAQAAKRKVSDHKAGTKTGGLKLVKPAPRRKRTA